MITLLLIIIAILIAFLYFKAKFDKLQEGDTWLESPYFWKGITMFIILFVLALVQPFTLQRVDAGHVGVKVNLTGDSRGVGKFEYRTGIIVINSWISRLYEFPTYQQTIEYPEQVVITKGGFSAKIHPTFNYSLLPGNVGDMFSNLRLAVKDVEQGWLKTAIVGAINDVANRWAVDDIFNHREQFEGDIVKEVQKRTAKWFDISGLRTNIVPPEALQASIEAKTKAIQEVQVAEGQTKVAVAEGERKIATARADSAAMVIAAAGEAEAIRRKQLSLTPEYIEYTRVLRWNGVLSTVQGGNNPFIYQLPK